MLTALTSIILALVGATIGGLVGAFFARVQTKDTDSSLEMFRIGAKSGPTAKDREKARETVERGRKWIEWNEAFSPLAFAAVGAIAGYGNGHLLSAWIGWW